MIDRGCGAHVTNFDENAIPVHGESAKLATITGIPVPMGSKKQSTLKTNTGDNITVTYNQSDKVMFLGLF